jgi:FlaA1/EpsC-like NDP-sugar epimerase
MTAGRAAARGFTRRRHAYVQNVVIVGAGDVGQLIAHGLLQHPEYGINLVGFLDATPKPRREDLRHLPLLGPPDRAAAIVSSFDIQRGLGLVLLARLFLAIACWIKVDSPGPVFFRQIRAGGSSMSSRVR